MLLKMEVSEHMREANMSDSLDLVVLEQEEVWAMTRVFIPSSFLMGHLQTGLQGCVSIKVFLPSGISSTSIIV